MHKNTVHRCQYLVFETWLTFLVAVDDVLEIIPFRAGNRNHSSIDELNAIR